MPEHWSVPRIAGRLHRAYLEPLGFSRKGNLSVREDGGLHRSVRFYDFRSAEPSLQLVAVVRVAGLPAPLTSVRHDSLSLPGTGRHPRPPSADDLPAALVAEVSGPVAEFLTRAPDRAGFVLQAQDLFLDGGRGTGPLQAAAFAAAMLGDLELATFLARRVANEEGSPHYLADFQKELHHVMPAAVEPQEPYHWLSR